MAGDVYTCNAFDIGVLKDMTPMWNCEVDSVYRCLVNNKIEYLRGDYIKHCRSFNPQRSNVRRTTYQKLLDYDKNYGLDYEGKLLLMDYMFSGYI